MQTEMERAIGTVTAEIVLSKQFPHLHKIETLLICYIGKPEGYKELVAALI